MATKRKPVEAGRKREEGGDRHVCVGATIHDIEAWQRGENKRKEARYRHSEHIATIRCIMAGPSASYHIGRAGMKAHLHWMLVYIKDLEAVVKTITPAEAECDPPNGTVCVTCRAMAELEKLE